MKNGEVAVGNTKKVSGKKSGERIEAIKSNKYLNTSSLSNGAEESHTFIPREKDEMDIFKPSSHNYALFEDLLKQEGIKDDGETRDGRVHSMPEHDIFSSPINVFKKTFLSASSFKLRRHKSINGEASDVSGFQLYAKDPNSMSSLNSSINAHNLKTIDQINDSSRNVNIPASPDAPKRFESNGNTTRGAALSTDDETITSEVVELSEREWAEHECNDSAEQQDTKDILKGHEEAGVNYSSQGQVDLKVKETEVQANGDSASTCHSVHNEEESRVTRQKKQQIRTLNHGIRRFNLNPKKGLRYLQDNGIIKTVEGDHNGNAKRVAKFLRSTRGLNKEQIGLILGDEDEMFIKVLDEYMNLFEFSDGATISGVEIGLRKVLALFKPPGEGQKIDRILEAFSKKFMHDNKDNFRADVDDTNGIRKAEFKEETTFIVSYLIIMLNVDLHNPNNASRRMTKKTFISRCKRLDDGKDLPEIEAGKLYDRILKDEIKLIIDRDDLSGNLFTNPDKCGWLMKKGSGSMGRWSRRWFILSENTLYYFKNSEDVEPQGFIPLENLIIRSKDSSFKRLSAKAPTHFATGKRTSPRGVDCTNIEHSIMNGDNEEAGTKTQNHQNANLVGGEGSERKQRTDTITASTSISSISTNASSMATHATEKGLNSYQDSWSSMTQRWFWHTKDPVEKRNSLRSVLNRFRSSNGGSPRGPHPLSRSSSTSALKKVSTFGCAGSAYSSQMRLTSFAFELCPLNPALKVKSAKVSKYGDLVLGQHRTIKLRADSRQESLEWIKVLNQKRMYSTFENVISKQSGTSR